MKQVLLFIMLVVLICMVIIEAKPSKTTPRVEHKIIRGDEPLPGLQAIPDNPDVITDSPGIIVGYTYYDYQTNGSTGNRVAVSSDGSVYFCWTNLFSWPYPPGVRHVYYNLIDADGNWLEPGLGNQLSSDLGSGYTNLDMIYGNRVAIAYHVSPSSTVVLAVEDYPPGFGIFTQYSVPNDIFPQNPPDSPGKMMWPYIAIDRNNRVHIAYSENTPQRMQRLGYVRSNDGGVTWTAPQLVDTIMVISSVVDASPVSDRVVLAYCKPVDTLTQWNNNVVYYESEDGTTWDWRYGRHNITNYGTNGDSLWAYTDIDAIFDYNDYLHVIWNAQWVTDESVYYRTFLLHYNEETDEINTITAMPDSLWADISGNWNRPICKMNLGVQEYGNVIFATWTQFDTSDVSASGYGNGDLYISYTDDGTHWQYPENMTNSHTPGCFPGECDNDHWSTLADVVTNWTPDIFYVDDKDAGGIPQTEGTATLNPMLYLPFAITDIEENPGNRPMDFSLEQNFPNPFNAQTTISFNMKNPGPVKLRIYDITGALMETLVDESMPPGRHQVTWDAGNLASGVYFYKLTCSGTSAAGKAVLIK